MNERKTIKGDLMDVALWIVAFVTTLAMFIGIAMYNQSTTGSW